MATAFRLDMTDGARWAASIFVATIIAFVVAALLLGAISNNEEQSAKAIVGALVISSATGPLAAVSMVRLGLQQSYAPRKAIIYTFAAFVMAGPLCLMLAANALYTDLDENLPYLQRWLYATKYKETPRFTATGGNCSIKEGVEPALECLLTATLLTHNSVVLHRNIYSVSLHEKLSPQLLLEDENAPLDPDEVQGKSRITDGKAAIVLFSVDQGFDAITIEKDKPINLSLTIQKAACGTIEHSFLYPPPLQLYISIETMPLNQGAGEGVLLNASTSMVNSLPYGAVLSGKVDDFALLGTWKLPTRLLYKFMDKCEHRPKRHE
jgi:hypothetical protein